MAGSKADDDASKMAEKLLQGWTMLAEYCPMEGCLAPLMRSREGRRYCVSHEMFVMSPEEAEAMRESGAGPGGIDAAPAPAHAADAPAAPAPASPERIDFYQKLKQRGGGGPGKRGAGRSDEDLPVAGYGDRVGADRRHASLAGAKGSEDDDAGAEAEAKTTVVVSEDVAAVARATVATLAKKMEEARRRLETADVSQAEFERLARAVETIAGTSKACSAIAR